MNTKKVLLGLFAGLAAGATLGILFSPDKGTSTRNRISRRGEDLLDGMDAKLADFAKMFMDKFESLKSTDYMNEAKSGLSNSIDRSAEAVKSKINS